MIEKDNDPKFSEMFPILKNADLFEVVVNELKILENVWSISCK